MISKRYQQKWLDFWRMQLEEFAVAAANVCFDAKWRGCIKRKSIFIDNVFRARLMSKFKCPLEHCAMLQMLRYDLASAEVHYDHAEEERKFFMKAGNIEAAKVMSNTTNFLLKTIMGLEKQIENLENVCL